MDNTKHYAALPYKQLPAFFSKLHIAYTTSARALEFTILTAARTGDTIGATWDEIDFEAKTWTIPAARLKGKKNSNRQPHIVPLNARALEILNKQNEYRVSDFIFPGNKPRSGLSNMANKIRLEKLEARNPLEGMKPKQLCEFYGEPPKDPPDYRLPWEQAKADEVGP